MSMYCPHCQSELTGSNFCTVCGTKIERTSIDQGYAAPQPQPSASLHGIETAASPKLPMALWIGIGATVLTVIVIAAIMLSCNRKPDFQELYNQYCHPTWADVGRDNSYLRIDTNPKDIEDRPITYREAYYALEEINMALGLPEYLFQEFGETTAADGLQEYTADSLRITWRYHPDSGLEVTYRAY